jgi:hypothetical protein
MSVTLMKCACDQCLCVVPVDSAIMVEDKPYCSSACAEGHKEGTKGCGHKGCNCG